MSKEKVLDLFTKGVVIGAVLAYGLYERCTGRCEAYDECNNLLKEKMEQIKETITDEITE